MRNFAGDSYGDKMKKERNTVPIITDTSTIKMGWAGSNCSSFFVMGNNKRLTIGTVRNAINQIDWPIAITNRLPNTVMKIKRKCTTKSSE